MNSVLKKNLNRAFPTLSDDGLEMLFNKGKVIYSPAKTCITGPNDADFSMYVCLSGVVKINYESEDGEELSITYLSEGDVFGELSAIDKRDRSAYCIAKTDCSLLKISSKKVKALLKESVEFNQAIIDVLIRRIRETDEKLFCVGKHSASVRIIGELIKLAQPESKGSDSYEIPFVPTHQEIALLAIVSREQTTRTLKKLKNLDLIEKSEDRFKIKSIQALQESAHDL